LEEGRGLVTVLTSPNARILDVLTLIAMPDAVGLITLPGNGGSTAQFLKARIFFNDNVEVVNLSQDYVQVLLEGPQAHGILEQMGLVIPKENRIFSSLLGDTSVIVIGQSGLDGGGCRMLLPSSQLESLVQLLISSGAQEMSNEIYNILRVEAGHPGVGNELSDDYTPLEANLESAIATNKGCYTGQEVIARQMTYDKITRRLVGLQLDVPVEEGSIVKAEDKRVGNVTSYVYSPRFGHVALAYIKRPFNIRGSQVLVEFEGEITQAVVVDLPFDRLDQDMVGDNHG
jgi:folate-binding protein YgfZ